MLVLWMHHFVVAFWSDLLAFRVTPVLEVMSSEWLLQLTCSVDMVQLTWFSWHGSVDMVQLTCSIDMVQLTWFSWRVQLTCSVDMLKQHVIQFNTLYVWDMLSHLFLWVNVLLPVPLVGTCLCSLEFCVCKPLIPFDKVACMLVLEGFVLKFLEEDCVGIGYQVNWWTPR